MNFRLIAALSLATALTVGTWIQPVSVAQAATAQAVDVRANVLVLDDGSSSVAALTSRMNAEGMPFTTIDLASSARTTLTATYLAGVDQAGIHARYSGVIAPNEAPSQLAATELAVLHDYEATFGVREVVAYTWANPAVGLNYAAYLGSVDGLTATVTAAGLVSPFSYLKGNFRLDDVSASVNESYAFLATPLDPATFIPLVTVTVPGTETQGSILGVYTTGGREQMVSTLAANANQTQALILDHGVLAWLTRGVSTSFSRNYLSVHIDDVLLPDGLWDESGNCTAEDTGCQATDTARMTAADVATLVAWQSANGAKLDMVFNGAGAASYKEDNVGTDPLEAALLANKSRLRWINHTWSHEYLGCIQNLTTVPWTCTTSTTGSIAYASAATINTEITSNSSYASTQRLPGYTATTLVTGEHSGLKTLPQMTVDNPNLASVLRTRGIKYIASDASREKAVRTIGSATTVPRYPTNIYYNAASKSAETDEYNWIYTSTEDGGSGACSANPGTMTCVTPLDTATGFDTYIVPAEARGVLLHMLGNDSRPHYAHQSNLTGDRILYPVLDASIASYKSTFAANTPIVNPTMADAGLVLNRQAAWKPGAKVTLVIKGNQLVVANTGATSATVPLTLLDGSTRTVFGLPLPFGAAYQGQTSGWLTLRAGQRQAFALPSSAGFATSATWSAAGSGA